MQHRYRFFVILLIIFFEFCPTYAQFFVPDMSFYPAPTPYVDPSIGMDPYTTAEMNRIMTDLIASMNQISNPNNEISFKSPMTSRVIRTKLQDKTRVISFDNINWVKFSKFIGEASPALMIIQSEDDPELMATFRTHPSSSSITISDHGRTDVYFMLGLDGQIINPGPVDSYPGSYNSSPHPKQPCTVCHGTGFCPLCKGSGRSTSPTYGIGSPGPCNYCSGGGKCPKCQGH